MALDFVEGSGEENNFQLPLSFFSLLSSKNAISSSGAKTSQPNSVHHDLEIKQHFNIYLLNTTTKILSLNKFTTSRL